MVEIDTYPSFITVDGAEGGYRRYLQESLKMVLVYRYLQHFYRSSMLEKYGIRNKVKILRPVLVTPDKIAIALGLGADLVNIARGMMISVGCIMSQQCHLNTCPVGVATTDPKKEKGLIVDENNTVLQIMLQVCMKV